MVMKVRKVENKLDLDKHTEGTMYENETVRGNCLYVHEKYILKKIFIICSTHGRGSTSNLASSLEDKHKTAGVGPMEGVDKLPEFRRMSSEEEREHPEPSFLEEKRTK